MINDTLNYDVAIIGGGPSGMAAALGAKRKGAKRVLIIERSDSLGGILLQCIHNGFGLHRFKTELTGPEYAARYEDELKLTDTFVLTNTMALQIEGNIVTCINSSAGIFNIQATAIVLSMGCRERSRGALNIPGTRPAGVFSAGTAQKLVNITGKMPGKKIVILGSGDIGLIMARRMTLEGAKVEAVCEIMPHSSGLTRNIVQCLNDFEIPLYLSTTVVNVHGENRVSGVTIAKVDEKLNPIKETERFIECDTLLLSVGLIPENELTERAGLQLSKATSGVTVNQYRQTIKKNIFAAGNVLHVHDLVDFVSEESEIAGESAAEFANNNLVEGEKTIDVLTGEFVRYVVPQRISLPTKNVKLFFRVSVVLDKAIIRVKAGDKVIAEKNEPRAVPGEMLTIILKELKPSEINSITVEVVKR